MHTNRLIQEKSPYLQQHAHNPVEWYPWGEEAFAKARSENKPIFLSIGYSTCHWCHVMERESFESEEIAAVLNRYFVPVKVDREERPDVDRIYMQFVQATTGSGGWPMSVWLTPDLKPFFGGTYFPPDNAYGRPGFRFLLERLAEAWATDRTSILQSGDDVLEQLNKLSAVASAGPVEEGVLESGFYHFRRSFDSRLGGFGEAPKFPRPSAFNFLLRYAYRTAGADRMADQEATEMVLKTLREMSKGGMNDQLGGGFHRYSVDERWFVPHFEKMLYDQAQLAVSYLEAYQVTRDESFAENARDIFDYVLRDMTDRDGGFYSAEDADSVIDPEQPQLKGEGAFYIWSAAELQQILTPQEYERFAYRFGVEPGGNVANDPHGEFTGRNILYQAHTIADVALHFGSSEAEIGIALAAAGQKVLANRATRVRPHLDDKVLTAWNGLMVSAFAKGARVLAEPRYREAAERAAWFIHDRMYDRGSNHLLRRYREGEAAIRGFLDDYAFFANGLLDLYEVSFEEHWLTFAEALTRRMCELFEDTAAGGFFSTTAHDASLVMRMKEDYDAAEPSGNAVAILLLLRLANMTGRGEFRSAADRALRAFGSRMRQMPSGVPQMLVGLMYSLTPPKQIVLAGEPVDTFVDELRRRFLPFHEVMHASPESPFEPLRDKSPMDGKPAAFVCENFTCNLPVTEPAKMAELIQ